MAHSVLIVEDDPKLADNISVYLGRHGYDTRAKLSGEEGLAEFDVFKPDLVMVDFQLTGMDGLEVLKRIRAADPQIKVIMMTGKGGVDIAVQAMKAGAHDYISKPLVLSEVKLLLDKAVGHERLEGALAYYQKKEAEQSGLSKLLGESECMVALRHKIQQLIDAEYQLKDSNPPSVLIMGETGTGKELVARALHFDGQRRDKPFVEINCASIPGHLMEAELFGFERGAFTDAKARKPGLVETAADGTLFLDEIGEIELGLQAKLLKLLEDKNVRRLGGVREHSVNVRIIAATNQNLEAKVRAGGFRPDLFYRLNMINVEVPPLRERVDDAVFLAQEFLRVQCSRYGKQALSLSKEAITAVKQHPWPGNVRELRNGVERAVLSAESEIVEPAHLALSSAETYPSPNVVATSGISLEEGTALGEVEARLVKQALDRTSWNVSHAARLLGVSRDTLRYRMQKYDLRPPR